MAETLHCACGRALTGETGDALLSAVEAHLLHDHRELLRPAPDDGVAQLHDEPREEGS